MMLMRAFIATKKLFCGDLDVNPVKLTIVQSVMVTLLASILAVSLYETIGVHYPGIGYQLFATLVIASTLAPIFLYPTFRTSGLLRQANATIEAQASTDHLTGLPNMLALSTRLNLQLTDFQPEHGFAVHFIDLDRFKQINDSLGHDAGNQLLIDVSRRLQKMVAGIGFVARYGGDEFVVLQNDAGNAENATRFALEMRSRITDDYMLGDEEVTVGATVGTALVPDHGTEPEQVLKAADIALYYAKEAGLEHRMFSPNLATQAQARREIEGVLRTAIKNRMLKPYFQSIVRTDNPLKIAGFEALARIELPDGELLYPNDFIPVAESTGMVVEMGDYILQQACMECMRWQGDLFVAVNVSPIQFLRSDFVKTVQDALQASGLPAARLELEITESVLINDIAYIGPVLNHLREMGVRIALDDFGSGYCGLHYLRQFTIDKIKVDKSIIDDAGTVQIATNILRSISQIAKEMDLTVTAEGVDSIAKAEFLAVEKCAEQLQGFLFSRPVSADGAYRMQKFMGQGGSQANVVSLPDYAREHQAS